MAEITEDDDNGIKEAFRRGLLEKCAEALWIRIEEELGTKNRTALTQRFHMRRQRFYEWKTDRVGLDEFYIILTELKWGYNNADPLPTIRERLAAGYIKAVSAATVNRRPDARRAISFEEFLAVSFLHGDMLYGAIRDQRREPTAEEWGQLSVRVRQRMVACEASFQIVNERTLPIIKQEWEEPVLRCLFTIPFEWMDRWVDESAPH